MAVKSTNELEQILSGTHPTNINDYLQKNADSLLTDDRPFSAYMRALIHDKRLRQQDVFLRADIPERYGYKLLSEEKHTRQRDIILRICYGAEFSLSETQRALKIYGMSPLYARIARDAILMTAFEKRPGTISDVSQLLVENGEEALRPSGVTD